MSSPSQSFCLSSSSMKEEVMVNKKQGVVSILGSDCQRSKSASLRTTLSADMSSKKWQAEHGFYPLKKIASSQGFLVTVAQSSSPSSEEYDQERPHDAAAPDQGQFDLIWSSIQEKKEKNKEAPEQFDMWSSIISQKSTVAGRSDEEPNNTNPLPPPYVHPLVKRSASCLSTKSLQICTESLGSETGSDSFSSSSSETDTDAEDAAAEEEKEEISTMQHDDLQAPRYNIPPPTPAPGKKSPPSPSPSPSPSPRSRSFPPPITSLSSLDGASLHMRPHRNNGRLVLEAVSVPSQNNFHAQRQDGRLVLTFIDTPNQKQQADDADDDIEQFAFEFEDAEEKNDISGKDEEEVKFVMEQAPKGSSGPVSLHRLALVMNDKSLVLANSNPTAWPNKAAAAARDQPITPLTQSLPPWPPVARMIPTPLAAVAAEAKGDASFHINAYEYFWRAKPMASVTTYTNKLFLHKNLMMPNEQQQQQQQQLIVLRGNKADYFVPIVKGCKEPRRVLSWEPECIATS